MRVAQQRGGDALDQPVLNRAHGPARRQAGAVAQAEDVGVHGHGAFPEHHVQHHVRGLAADARQRLQRHAVGRDLARVPGHQNGRKGGDILGLGLPQADAPDVGADALGAQRGHGGGGGRFGEQRGRRLVDGGVRRLRRQDHRDQQGEGVGVQQLRRRFGVVAGDGGDEGGGLVTTHQPGAAGGGGGPVQGRLGGAAPGAAKGWARGFRARIDAARRGGDWRGV